MTPRESLQQQCKAVHNLIVSAGVASAWRGAWTIADIYFFSDRAASVFYPLLIGSATFLLMVLLRNEVQVSVDGLHPGLGRGVDLMWSYVALWCGVVVWRGVWQAWDMCFDLGDPRPTDDSPLKSAWVSHTVGVAVLVMLGMLRSATAPPVFVVPDGPPLLDAVSVEAYQKGTIAILTSRAKSAKEPTLPVDAEMDPKIPF